MGDPFVAEVLALFPEAVLDDEIDLSGAVTLEPRDYGRTRTADGTEAGPRRNRRRLKDMLSGDLFAENDEAASTSTSQSHAHVPAPTI